MWFEYLDGFWGEVGEMDDLIHSKMTRVGLFCSLDCCYISVEKTNSGIKSLVICIINVLIMRI